MSFTTRIELHDANYQHYQILHQAMYSQGFSDTITSDDKITYKLPPAEYNFTASKDYQDVLQLAKNAAAKTGCKYAVVVTESYKRTWFGLDKI